MNTAESLAERYFTSWTLRGFDTVKTLLADDVDFAGALGTTRGVEETIAGLKGMARILFRIDVKLRISTGDDVMTWFELHTTVAPPAPTVNWMHIEDGKISRIQVTFDPRRIIAGLSS